MVAVAERTLSWSERIQQIQSIPLSEVPTETLRTLHEDVIKAVLETPCYDTAGVEFKFPVPDRREDGDIYCILAAAHNTPSEIHDYIMIEKSRRSNRFWAAIAGNPCASPTVLSRLWELMKQLGYVDMVESLFLNPNCPSDVLASAAEEKYERVRKNVSANLNTPFNILVKLLHDDKLMVSKEAEHTIGKVMRINIASDPLTPISTLGRMLNSKEKEVRQAAVDTLVGLPQFIGFPLEWIIASVREEF